MNFLPAHVRVKLSTLSALREKRLQMDLLGQIGAAPQLAALGHL
jgi:hypothetical protein